MDIRKKLFLTQDPYCLKETESIFLAAVRQNIAYHTMNCPHYAQLLRSFAFSVEDIQSEEDLYRIPVIPTLYFKRNRLFSVPEEKLVLNATSSGTKGVFSTVGFDRSSLFYGVGMMLRFFSYYHVVSLCPTNYIVLGYEPSSHANMGAIKSAYGTTKFAPALHREYALKDTGSSYETNVEGLKRALLQYAESGFPVRFVGFPPYLFFLVQAMQKEGISLRLNSRSKILLGGGWKQFSQAEIDRDMFYEQIEQTLGINKSNCLEFFSAAEHPIPYVKCKNGHFHVPVYSRVIIRDVHTLEPVSNGMPGLLSFVTPLMSSMPLISVVTDDLAVRHNGADCGCGIETPFFVLKGRAGADQIKTCAAGAAELMGGLI